MPSRGSHQEQSTAFAQFDKVDRAVVLVVPASPVDSCLIDIDLNKRAEANLGKQGIVLDAHIAVYGFVSRI
jgi:hypothetical protein